MAKLKSHLRTLTMTAGCCAVCLLSGCRNLDNAQVDVLERELRQQEDYIYELEDYLIEYSEKLRQARLAQCPPGTAAPSRTGSKSRAPLPEPTIDEDIERPSLPLNGRDKLATPSTEAPAASEAPPAAPAEVPPAAPAVEEVNPEELEAPPLQIGPIGSASQGSDRLATTLAPSAEGPLLIPDPIDYQADAESITVEQSSPEAVAAVAEPMLAAPQVNAPRLTAQQLKVRRLFREPPQDAESPGSLLVVVEGVNATDEPADIVGAASLMVMARDANGALKRVDRWDFTTEETAAAWQSSPLGDGLHLELPLTSAELPEGELELWARVVDDGGAKLLTSAEDPYRFEAGSLVAMADAPASEMIAENHGESSQLPSIEGEQEVAAETQNNANAANSTASAEEPKPRWRASAVRLDQGRVEGFATTDGNKPASWTTTTPIKDGQTRVAATQAKTSGPTWKRSTRAAVVTESKPEWSAER